MTGISGRETSSALPVLRIHFSADTKKRPGTPEGDAWIARASAAYPGGTNSARWRKEMGIEWGALGGLKLFPEWQEWVARGRIVIQPFDPHGYKLFASYDHGWRNPLCYTVFGVNYDGDIVALWETYGAGIGVVHMARVIRGENVILPDGRRLPGNPHAGQEIYRLADPQLWAEDQPMNDGTTKSVAELYRRHGVFFQKAEKGGDTMVAEWLHGHFWKDPERPLFRVTTLCPNLIWELGQLRHKEFSAKVALTRDQPEELVDKDNHAWDALKFFLKKFPPKPRGERAAERGNSFAWWQKMGKRGFQRESFRIGG